MDGGYRGRGGFRGAPRGGRGAPRGARGGGRGGFGMGRPAPYGPGPRKEINPTKLHVSNIPEGVTSKQLEEVFMRCGTVLECDIIRDFAFVHYKTEAEATAAVEKLNGYEIGGSHINVKNSTSTLRMRPGTAKGDCFRCGGRGHSSLECPTELRERGLLPPRGAARYPPLDPLDMYDHYGLPPRHSYLDIDPYERLERDPMYRRRLLAAICATDPYMRGSLRAAAAGVDLPPGPESVPPEADPYSRPPPEFYQRRGRGRGAPPPTAAAGSAQVAPGNGYEQQSARPADDPYFYNDDYEKTNSAGEPGLHSAVSRLTNALESGILSGLPL